MKPQVFCFSVIAAIVAATSSAHAREPIQKGSTASHCEAMKVKQCKVAYPGGGVAYSTCAARALRTCSQPGTSELGGGSGVIVAILKAVAIIGGVEQAEPKPAPPPSPKPK